MKEIKTVGIIGMGTIGVSISCILQQAGLNVIGFKHESRKGQLYKEFIEKGKIVIVNNTDNNILPRRNILKIKITSSLQEIVDKSDLILNCCRFPDISHP
jgi:lactate dehydrogenase-like 2-hydroxyacid dehydrogenase